MGRYDKGDHFDRIMRQYFPTQETTWLNKFRGEVVKGMKALQEGLPTKTKRIDGLNWTFTTDGDGFVVDDFGRSLQFDSSGLGYHLTGLEPLGKGTEDLDSAAALRERVATLLEPVK